MSKPFTLKKRGPVFFAEFRIRGERFRRSTRQTARGLAEREAQRLYEEALADVIDPSPTGLGPRFWQAADAYVAGGGEARFLPRLVEYFGPKLCTGEIDRSALDAAAKALFPTAAPATVRRQLHVPVNAVVRHSRGERRLRGVDRARVRWLTPEEAERLIAAADARTARMILFLLGSGCRPSEMFALKAHQVRGKIGECLIENPDPERRPARPARPDGSAYPRAHGLPWPACPTPARSS